MTRRAAFGLLPVLVALAGLATSASAAVPAAAAPVETTETAPVVVDGVELFRLRGISALPAAERATMVAARIRVVAGDHSIQPEQVESVPGEEADTISAAGTPVLMVLDADAEIEGIDRTILAKAMVLQIRESILEYRRVRAPGALIRGALTAVAALVALLVFLVILRALFRRLHAMLMRRLDKTVKTIETRSLSFMKAERMWLGLARALNGLRVAVSVAAGMVCLYTVLGSFPWTRPVALNLIEYLLDPIRAMSAALIDYIPSLMFLAVLGLVTWIALKFLKLLFGELERGTITWSGFYPEWGLPTYRLVRALVLALVLVIGYPYLPGSGSEAFKGVSLFLGVILSLGSSSAISNIIASYLMTYRRAFRVGDRIRVGDELGDVTETRLLATHLRTIRNEEIVIPNSTILNSNVINYSSLARERGIMLQTSTGIGYETPWRQVEAMLLTAAEQTAGVRTEPKAFVLQKELGDFAVQYVLCAFIDDPRRMPLITTDLHRNILDEFNRHGVQIMTPAYEGDPDMPKIVPRDRWHESPARPQEGGGPARKSSPEPR